MSFLRPHILWLVAVQAVGAWVIGAEAQQTAVVPVEEKAVDPLMAALPERHVPGLEELLRVGLENGPTILIRRWEAEQSVQNARVARSPMLPQVAGWVQGGMILEQRKNEGQGDVPDRTVVAALYNFGISQNLFHWGALSKGHEVGKLYSAISSRNMEETRRLLAVDLRRRYFNMVIATGALELARMTLADSERDVEFVKKQMADGFASVIDLAVVSGKITTTSIEIQRLTGDCDILIRDFARLSGVPVEKLPKAGIELPMAPDLNAVINGMSGDEAGRPSFQLQNLEDYVRAEGLNYEIHKTRLRPKLGLSFSVNQDNRNPDGDDLGPRYLITSWNAFATVNWTVFDGFNADASKRAALARKRAYEADRDHTARIDADSRRADVTRLQLVWAQLKDSEKSLAIVRNTVGIVVSDAAAGWVPASSVDEVRRQEKAALQATNSMRAEFYTALATYFSNRGIDPVLHGEPR